MGDTELKIEYAPISLDQSGSIARAFAQTFLQNAPEQYGYFEDDLLASFRVDIGVEAETGQRWIRLESGIGLAKEIEWDGTLEEACSLAGDMGEWWSKEQTRTYDDRPPI